MEELITCRMKPYIQPFERKLALAELTALSDCVPQINNDKNPDYKFSVQTIVPASVLANKLSYWESAEQNQIFFTNQILREATVNLVRNGVILEQIEGLVNFNIEKGFPNRRCLRYGTHGLHEYRGKFFPQLVRALINIAGVPKNGVVADPMSGSGTTLVETLLAECNGVGLDMNPLSVLIGQAKCELLSVSPDEIIKLYNQIASELNSLTRKSPHGDKLKYFHSLPQINQTYLINWFSEQVLEELDSISQVIKNYKIPAFQNLLRLCLSNILRRVSWQKGSDLRVRKEVRLDAEIYPIKEFIKELEKSVKTVSSLLYQIKGTKLGSFDLQGGNACDIKQIWKNLAGKVDVVITSPPYATALPYLDTDRLSLMYLGLLTRKEQRQRDLEMIGNREISEKVRKEYWQVFQETKDILPKSVVFLIEKIETLNSNSDVGFRRKNLSALLGKYFFDMSKVLEGIFHILKPGSWAFVVVGNNHTIAGGKRIEIETAKLLSDIAESLGFNKGEHISMEMLVSREIFKKNAVTTEEILCLQKPK